MDAEVESKDVLYILFLVRGTEKTACMHDKLAFTWAGYCIITSIEIHKPSSLSCCASGELL